MTATTERMLERKIALVTGASSGIGRSAAVVLARHGATVVLADIDVTGGEETLEMVHAAGGVASFVPTDVTRSSDVEALIRRIVAEHGRLDAAFNNAGIEGTYGATTECTEEEWDRVLAVNLRGVWLCMKHEIPPMLAQGGGGAIVNASSVLGLVGRAGHVAYVASKHGVIGLTRAAALDYAKHDIRINAICPGVIRTPMMDSVIRSGRRTEAQMADLQPLGRIGTPEEVGEAVAWLFSDRARFMTGHAMPLDGGWTAQ